MPGIPPLRRSRQEQRRVPMVKPSGSCAHLRNSRQAQQRVPMMKPSGSCATLGGTFVIIGMTIILVMLGAQMTGMTIVLMTTIRTTTWFLMSRAALTPTICGAALQECREDDAGHSLERPEQVSS